MITRGQCKAARALLGWTQTELGARAKVSQRTIAQFETGTTTPYERTLRDIKAVLEATGLRFIEPQEGVTGRGVAFVSGNH